jgi:hypothetical protein
MVFRLGVSVPFLLAQGLLSHIPEGKPALAVTCIRQNRHSSCGTANKGGAVSLSFLVKLLILILLMVIFKL